MEYLKELVRALFNKPKLKPVLEKEQSYIYQIPKFIDPSTVLTLTNKGWYIGKRRISVEEASQLKAEAREFEGSYLWQLIRRDVHYIAYLQGTAKRRIGDEKAAQVDAIYAGAMYKDLEIIEEFIERCKKL